MKIQMVDGYKKFYAMWSMWAFALLGLAPQLFNMAIEFNILTSEQAPELLARAINYIAFFGAVSRLVKQQVLTAKPAASATDDIGSVV